jgi:hypothetical protein
MKIEKTLLVVSSYGYHSFGSYGSIAINSTAMWKLTYDGSMEGMKNALIDAQKNSSIVAEFKKIAKEQGVPEAWGKWLLFSVIDQSERIIT